MVLIVYFCNVLSSGLRRGQGLEPIHMFLYNLIYKILVRNRVHANSHRDLEIWRSNFIPLEIPCSSDIFQWPQNSESSETQFWSHFGWFNSSRLIFSWEMSVHANSHRDLEIWRSNFIPLEIPCSSDIFQWPQNSESSETQFWSYFGWFNSSRILNNSHEDA